MEEPRNRIQALREAAGMSRVQVAAVCGVKSEVTVKRWELGESEVPDKQKFRLADLFEVTPAHLMGWDRTEAAA